VLVLRRAAAPVLLELPTDAEGEDVLVTEEAGVAPEPALRIPEAQPETPREERARADGGVVEDAGQIRELAARDVTPDDHAVVAAGGPFLRRRDAGTARLRGIEARVVPGDHEERTRRIRAVDGNQEVAGPQMELVHEVE